MDILLKEKKSRCQWNSQLSRDLYLFLQEFLSQKNYLQLLNTSKRLFQRIKYETRRIYIQQNEEVNQFLFDKHYFNFINSLVASPYHQLTIRIPKDFKLQSLHEGNYNLVVEDWNASMLSLEFVNGRKSVTIRNLPSKNLNDIQQVRHLAISPAFELFHVGNEGIPGAESLSLIHCPKLVRIDSWKGLQKLILRYCYLLSDVSSLGDIPHLELHNCPLVKDLSCLKKNRYLTILSIGEIPKDNLLPSLSAISHASSLTTNIVYSRSNLEIILRAGHLRHLTLYDLQNLSFDFPVDHLISSVCPLQSLGLYSCRYLKSVHGLGSIPIVSLVNCPLLLNISCLGSGNRKVIMQNCPYLVQFDSLVSVPSLEIKSSSNFISLDGFTAIRSCRLVSLPSFRNHGMMDFSQLIHLEISHCPLLDSLKGFSSVAVVIINDCVNLLSLEGLRDNRKIHWTWTISNQLPPLISFNFEGFSLLESSHSLLDDGPPLVTTDSFDVLQYSKGKELLLVRK